ncbi:small RNA 2'-O-methyltransferase-like, partial [Saccoglossus kowalevskii]|uniref:Small RNA 2'-O-methyltransferase n=1 Tax=Saccoglossus kowalevskii TaxID=10224 RepID=A0ABM0MZD2_SACKO
MESKIKHEDCVAKPTNNNEDDTGDLIFTPRLYRQRYDAVVDIARKYQPKKVVDMGCSECKLLRKLKNESYIEELIGVDIDNLALESNQHLGQPLISDYLYPRDNPLSVIILCGSVADYDSRLSNCDMMACVELIEHLDPPVLEALRENIFHRIQPNVVVMTTPNADFNVLFKDFQGLRHWDHRFEWTRQQFQEWGNSIADQYNYIVTYSGVGAGPDGTQHLGQCSQMAVFIKSCKERIPIVSENRMPYLLIQESIHPIKKVISTEEAILLEVQYYVRLLRCQNKEDSSDDIEENNTSSDEASDCLDTITLERLLQFTRVNKLCASVGKL